jgi:hypothetical protein
MCFSILPVTLKRFFCRRETGVGRDLRRLPAGLIPLIVPITLLNHYIRKFGMNIWPGKVYLHPHPAELALRNHV